MESDVWELGAPLDYRAGWGDTRGKDEAGEGTVASATQESPRGPARM